MGDVSSAVQDLLRSLQADGDSTAPHALFAHFYLASLLASQNVYVSRSACGFFLSVFDTPILSCTSHAAAFEHAYLAVFLLERAAKPFLQTDSAAVGNGCTRRFVCLFGSPLRLIV